MRDAMQQVPFDDPAVASAFAGFPSGVRDRAFALRELIFETAAETEGVGRLCETLKWGQPTYLTPQTKAGSTIRIGVTKTGRLGLFTHCQTTIMSDFRALFPDKFIFDGGRGVLFDPDVDVDMACDDLRLLVISALTYRLRRPRV